MLSGAALLALFAAPGLAAVNIGPTAEIGTARSRHVAPKRVERRTRPLNRSRHWPAAESYKHARTMAPMPHCLRPVR
jgi:hypothetical protein